MSSESTHKLFDKGFLFNLNISRWSGRKMITEEDMKRMNVDVSLLPKDIVNYGRKLLVSRYELKQFIACESQARAYLAKYSVPFGIASSHFVPIKKAPEVINKLKSIKTDFDNAVDSFILRFEKIKQELKDKHPLFWNKCLSASYPSNPKNLRSKFNFSWSTFQITGISSIQQIDEEVAKDINDQINSQVSSFVEKYVNTMRNETVELCELMKCRVMGKPYKNEKEARKFTQRSLTMFRDKISQFRDMNIFGDKQIMKMLNDFENEHLKSNHTAEAISNNANIKNSLCETLSLIKKKAEDHSEDTSKYIMGLKRKIVL